MKPVEPVRMIFMVFAVFFFDGILLVMWLVGERNGLFF